MADYLQSDSNELNNMVVAAGISVEKQLLIRHMTEAGSSCFSCEKTCKFVLVTDIR